MLSLKGLLDEQINNSNKSQQEITPAARKHLLEIQGSEWSIKSMSYAPKIFHYSSSFDGHQNSKGKAGSIEAFAQKKKSILLYF